MKQSAGFSLPGSRDSTKFSRILRHLEPKELQIFREFSIFFLKWVIQTFLKDFYTNFKINEVRCIRLQILKNRSDLYILTQLNSVSTES